MKSNKSGNEFSVVLEKVGNQPLMTTKTLMRATGLGLSDAKKMVDKAPVTVATGMNSNKAIALKKELEALGNTVSIPGMETQTIPAATKKAAGAKVESTGITDEKEQSDLVKALAKAFEIVGKDGFINGDRVCNLLGDLVPKLEKERRRIKIAYSANAVTVLINEADKPFAVSEAIKRMVDYSDMADDVARTTILAIYEVLK